MQVHEDFSEIGEQTRRKLRCHFGLNENDIQLYSYFQQLNLSKIKQVLGITPTLNEVLVLQENFLNHKIEALLAHWKAQEQAAKAAARCSQQQSAAAAAYHEKSSQLLGVSPNDLSYYSRYGKAARILGDAPVRNAFV